MISEAKLRRLAASAGVDLMVLDLDYVLGWFLDGNRLYLLRIGTDA